jgi:hypothetical protein
MRWNRLRYENGMNHIVSDDLLLAVRETMDHAAPPGMLEGATVIDTVCLEQGGPCAVNRPYEEVVFHGLTIRVPSEDLQPLLATWQDAPLVTSLDQGFHRFTSWPWQCLVVAPEQRTDLLDLLDARADQAERRAAAFWANRESPQEILRKHNESRGMVAPYGPDKIARFRS